MMSSDGRAAARTVWTDAVGRELSVVEDSPGIVHITTEALGELLRLAGWTEQAEPIRSTAVQGTIEVLRDEHGRCQECGQPPAEPHRSDCPHASADTLHTRTFGQPYEQRPAPPNAVERR